MYQYAELYNSMLWFPDNLKEVQRKGFEISTKYNLYTQNNTYYLNISYQYVSAINKKSISDLDQSKDKQLIYVPEHSLQAYLSLKHKKNSISISNIFTSVRYTTTDNVEKLPLYNLIGIHFSREIVFNNSEFLCSFALNNIFNADYQVMSGRPMPGRNFSVSVKYSISK